jgi:hypothetical protein
MTPSARRAFLTATYLAGHAVCASACIALVVLVPFVSMIIVAIIGNDLGGPLFWPIFLILLLLSGFILALVLSILSVLTDALRLRWAFSRWIPPFAIWIVTIGISFTVFHDRAPIWSPLAFSFLFTVLFTIYWLSITVAWTLPKFILNQLHSIKN